MALRWSLMRRWLQNLRHTKGFITHLHKRSLLSCNSCAAHRHSSIAIQRYTHQNYVKLCKQEIWANPVYKHRTFSSEVGGRSDTKHNSALFLGSLDQENAAVVEVDLNLEERILKAEALVDNVKMRKMDLDVEAFVSYIFCDFIYLCCNIYYLLIVVYCFVHVNTSG